MICTLELWRNWEWIGSQVQNHIFSKNNTMYIQLWKAASLCQFRFWFVSRALDTCQVEILRHTSIDQRYTYYSRCLHDRMFVSTNNKWKKKKRKKVGTVIVRAKNKFCRSCHQVSIKVPSIWRRPCKTHCNSDC